MSALTPHIRVLRWEADALFAQSKQLELVGDANMAAWLVLTSMAFAKVAAADTLEAEERELEAKAHG